MGFAKLNQPIMDICDSLSNNCPAPLSERTDPEIPEVAGRRQMPTEVKEIGDSSMRTQESLSLIHLTLWVANY